MEDTCIIDLYLRDRNRPLRRRIRNMAATATALPKYLQQQGGFGGGRQRYLSCSLEYDSAQAAPLSQRLSWEGHPAYLHRPVKTPWRPQAGRWGDYLGTGGAGGVHRAAGYSAGTGAEGAGKSHRPLSYVPAGDGAERIFVPVLVSGFRTGYLGGIRLFPEQGHIHAPQDTGEAAQGT